MEKEYGDLKFNMKPEDNQATINFLDLDIKTVGLSEQCRPKSDFS